MICASTGGLRAETILLVGESDAPLIAFDALVGGPDMESASDFGFLQPVEDGYAVAAVRVRFGPKGVEATRCEGGLAPTEFKTFAGAYVCGEERPAPISYNPALKRIAPDILDPNGVWESDTFFIGQSFSMKIASADPLVISRDAMTAALPGSPLPGVGAIGRVSPAQAQESGRCGDGVAAFFPITATPACLDASLFEE